MNIQDMTKWQKLWTGDKVRNGNLRDEKSGSDYNERVLESAINVKSCGPKKKF